MKKMSLLNAATLFLVVMLLSASVFQCRKEGYLIKGLNRSFNGTSDSTLYAAFYESNLISSADATPDVNDVMKFRGVQTIVHEYCATSNCHNGPIAPKLDSYTEIMKYVTAGNPEGSKLWEFLTTNDFNKAMPPVNSNHEMNATDKTLLYNWIKNGAREKPNLADFRPAAISLIATGCGSANCHSQATATGEWAKRVGLLVPQPFASLSSTDTSKFTVIDSGGVKSTYYQLADPKRTQVWTAYKDSVKKFFYDTLANASFRPYKTFGAPAVASPGTRGPLNTYDDILMDIMYPKSIRSVTARFPATYVPPVYKDPITGKEFWVRGNFLNASSSMVSRIDSTLLLANPYTGIYATKHQGDMAFGDGGLKPHEIALIKAWYFADPNIPDVWKYGSSNVGIFKYTKTGNIITKK